MNEEIQTAYNEWLLMFGFREVPAFALGDDLLCLYRNHLHIIDTPIHMYYQLKTLEELTYE